MLISILQVDGRLRDNLSTLLLCIIAMDPTRGGGPIRGCLASRPVAFIPMKDTVESLRLRVPAFHPNLVQFPINDKVLSCCWHPPSYAEYLKTFHCIIPIFPMRLESTNNMGMSAAFTRATVFELWQVEPSVEIGITCCLWFDDCLLGDPVKVEFENPGTLIANGVKFWDGDLCYYLTCTDNEVTITEQFWLTMVYGKCGFVKARVHKWALWDQTVWKSALANVLIIYYDHEHRRFWLQFPE